VGEGYQADDDGRLEGLAETMVVPQYGVVLHDDPTTQRVRYGSSAGAKGGRANRGAEPGDAGEGPEIGKLAQHSVALWWP
jgi:hypothetical protein